MVSDGTLKCNMVLLNDYRINLLLFLYVTPSKDTVDVLSCIIHENIIAWIYIYSVC